MDLTSWALFALFAAAALVVVGHLYRRRETPGRGRTLLAALRWGALATLILLLFDPELPAPGAIAGVGGPRVLLDASLSMELPAGPADGSRWREATDRAAELARGGDVLLFGAEPRSVPADSLATVEPTAPGSRLLPALRLASEAGARRVVVLTDGGVEDAAEVARMLPRLGLDVEVRTVGDAPAPARALAEVEAPAWAEAGEPMRVRVGVAALGAEGDSVQVVARHDGRVVARAALTAPPEGRIAVAELAIRPEATAGGGLVRYDFALEPADAASADDVRSVYVHVGERPAGVALVSFRPDWEPRFLQPVLEQALGLPVRGFLHAGPGRYLRVGAGAEAGTAADEAEARRAVTEADLVVLHGLGDEAPAWAREAAREARRALVFPAGEPGGLGLPVTLAPPAPGEWYPGGALPASPVASLLATLRLDALPPLAGVRPVTLDDGAWAPLEASRGRSGAGEPVVVGVERGDRRRVVATADGYWRWALRGGEARQAYRRLWAALGGWLMQEDRAAAAAGVRPARRVAPRGEPLRWVAPGLAADSVALRLASEEGTVVMDTVLPLRGDTLVTPATAPGHYRYEARAFAGGEAAGSAEGPLTVESWSPEFTRAGVAVAGFAAAGGDGGGRPGGRPGRPLHTTPWPYLLVVLLMTTEWVLRRRWGLR